LIELTVTLEMEVLTFDNLTNNQLLINLRLGCQFMIILCLGWMIPDVVIYNTEVVSSGRKYTFFYILYLFFLCIHNCVGGTLLLFTKVLTIYHSWIHPLHHSPLSLSPPNPGIVSPYLIFPLEIILCSVLVLVLPRQ
jgi:hypothetical protein